MRIIGTSDYEQMSCRAASLLAAQVLLKKDCVLGLATGSTPLGIYRCLIEWYEKLKEINGGKEIEYTLEYKLDGLTLCLTYENGLFVGAATRGNGAVGEDVTEQVKTIKSIPLSIKYKGIMEAQGEGIMRLSALKAYNLTAKEPLKNARNGVAGAVRNLDPKVTASRNLDIVFYNVNYSEEEIKSLQVNKSRGFT